MTIFNVKKKRKINFWFILIVLKVVLLGLISRNLQDAEDRKRKVKETRKKEKIIKKNT